MDDKYHQVALDKSIPLSCFLIYFFRAGKGWRGKKTNSTELILIGKLNTQHQIELFNGQLCSIWSVRDQFNFNWHLKICLHPYMESINYNRRFQRWIVEKLHFQNWTTDYLFLWHLPSPPAGGKRDCILYALILHALHFIKAESISSNSFHLPIKMSAKWSLQHQSSIEEFHSAKVGKLIINDHKPLHLYLCPCIYNMLWYYGSMILYKLPQ